MEIRPPTASTEVLAVVVGGPFSPIVHFLCVGGEVGTRGGSTLSTTILIFASVVCRLLKIAYYWFKPTMKMLMCTKKSMEMVS